MQMIIDLMEKGYLPDFLMRAGIRGLVSRRLSNEKKIFLQRKQNYLNDFKNLLKESPLAEQPEKANEQHYEVPSEFFNLVLGKRLKYSGSLWTGGVRNLDQAEERMLDLYCQRNSMQDGVRVLDLGCGWGSLSLYLAERYPHAQITGVSNSKSQRQFIEEAADKKNLKNVRIITADINHFSINEKFDRIFSIEMLEHLRNYQKLFSSVHDWLTPEGQMFVHVFCHKTFHYFFETEGADNWMGRHFFTSGLMPSFDLLPQFQDHLQLMERHFLNGSHYQKTAEAWLTNLDEHREEVLRILEEIYGTLEAHRWLGRWRIFFAACSELFGFKGGDEWGIAHYVFKGK